MQFRLTRRFAQDCRIQALQIPSLTMSLLDDWIIDRMTIARKKVAVITHAKTYYTTVIPYSAAGGAKNIPKYFFRSLNQFMEASGFSYSLDAIQELEQSLIIFCKTDNRRILGHVNDFKYCIEGHVHCLPFHEVNFYDVAKCINEMPINVHSIGYTDANTLMYNLLAGSNFEKAN